MKEKSEYGPLLLRIALGALFLYAGIGKLANPSGPIGMLGSLGFPIPVFFAWVLLLSEIIFGLSVLVGWKVKYTVWPLVVVLLVATITAVLPNANGNYMNALFHLLGLAGLISIYLTGPGAASVERM